MRKIYTTRIKQFYQDGFSREELALMYTVSTYQINLILEEA